MIYSKNSSDQVLRGRSKKQEYTEPAILRTGVEPRRDPYLTPLQPPPPPEPHTPDFLTPQNPVCRATRFVARDRHSQSGSKTSSERHERHEQKAFQIHSGICT